MAKWVGPVLEADILPTARWAGGLVPARVKAQYQNGGLEYTLEIRVREDKAELLSLQVQNVDPAKPLTRFGGLPLQELMSRALNKVRWAPPVEGPKGNWRTHPAPIPGGRRRDINRSHLALVADVWKQAKAEGRPTRKAVREAFGASDRTAARWIALARAYKPPLIPKGGK